VIRQKWVTAAVATYRTLVWLKRLQLVAMGEAQFELEAGSRVRAEQCLAADALQRPLRSRFRARLMWGHLGALPHSRSEQRRVHGDSEDDNGDSRGAAGAGQTFRLTHQGCRGIRLVEHDAR
jgi:hypothetical protein